MRVHVDILLQTVNALGNTIRMPNLNQKTLPANKRLFEDVQ